MTALVFVLFYVMRFEDHAGDLCLRGSNFFCAAQNGLFSYLCLAPNQPLRISQGGPEAGVGSVSRISLTSDSVFDVLRLSAATETSRQSSLCWGCCFGRLFWFFSFQKRAKHLHRKIN